MIGAGIVINANHNPTVIVQSGDVFDAGLCVPDKPVVHTFTLINPHDYAVGLNAALPGCACTTATASASTIPPHGHATVTLRVQPEDGNIDGSAAIETTCGHARIQTVLLLTGHANIVKK